ncbi:DUF2764 family protein [Neptuniibacter marinus]|uniref:DUF2764 family protein n=1 Tax=Neptuniibacter marinus TaxID=1806670 RepID=UPI000AC664C4|nr:DUF2764 family protein [Neptuniibacter marinus]
MSDYYTLMTALPWLPELEQCTQLPISRIALDRRLTMLSDEGSAQLANIEALFHPIIDHYIMLTDKDLIAQWKADMSKVESPVMLELINYQMELKTLLAALRCRAVGLDDPSQFHGAGRWVQLIKKHWFEPGFGLDRVCPQLLQLQRLMSKEKPMLVEQYYNQQLWTSLRQAEHSHHFSFEALACFVLRWAIAERCLRYDGDKAVDTFNKSRSVLLELSGLNQQLLQGNN